MSHFLFAACGSFLTCLLPWLVVSHVVFIYINLELEFTLLNCIFTGNFFGCQEHLTF